MSNIPAARKRIIAIAAQMRGLANEATRLVEELHEAEGMMHKNFTKPKAPATSTAMTPELADAIWYYAKANPKATQHDIGAIFNVNPGRVSEALSGRGKA